MIRNFLSVVPFVLCSLLAPDPGAPAGGGGSVAPAASSPFDGDKPPQMEGDTLEAKLTFGDGIVAKLWNAGKDSISRLATANNDRKKLEDQFNAVSGDLTKEKEEHGKTKGELGTAKTTITGLTTERDNANKNVERLEKLCNLRGIDPKTVVPPSTAPENNVGNAWEQYQNLRTQEKEGKVEPGTAFRFYQKNEKALKEYGSEKRSSSE